MTLRGLSIFSAITVLLIVGAVVFYPGGTTVRPEPGAPFFPNLAEGRLAAAQKITVTAKGEQVVTVERDGDSWRVRELHNYPARPETVRRTLVSLAELRPYERKTADKDRLGALNLDDPDRKGTSARRLTVTDGDGGTVADIVIGRSNPSSILLGYEMLYVRKPDETQAWLAVGDPKIDNAPLDWVDRRLMDVDANRVRTVEQSGREPGTTIDLDQEKPAAGFTVRNLPEGRKVKSATTVRYLAETLEALDLSQVRPVKDVDFDANKVGVAVYRTFDGLVVTATLAAVEEAEDKKSTWVRLEAKVDEERLVDGEPPEHLKAAADVRAEAEAINRVASGWAYVLPTTSQRFMTYKMEELLEPLPEKEEKKEGENDKDE